MENVGFIHQKYALFLLIKLVVTLALSKFVSANVGPAPLLLTHTVIAPDSQSDLGI